MKFCHVRQSVARGHLVAGVVWAVVVLHASYAEAHGRAFKTTGIALGPARWWQTIPSVWLVGLSFGVLVSHDQAQSFQWICEDALGGPTGADPIVTVADATTLAIGNRNGLFISRDGGCQWRTDSRFAPPAQVSAVAVHPSRPATWWVAENTPEHGCGRLWRTDDNAEHFTLVPFDLPSAFIHAIAVSPANPQRLVMAGSNNRSTASCLLYVSENGGKTWRGGPVRAAPAASGMSHVALHPQDAEQMLLASLDITNNTAQILRSEDAGKSFTAVLKMSEPATSIAYAKNGRGVVVAGTHHVYVSDDHGRTFALLPAPQGNACVTTQGRNIYACGAEGLDGFSVATAAFSSIQWQPILRFGAMQGPFHCKQGTPVYDLCATLWPEQAQKIGALAAIPDAAAAN